MGKRSRDTPLSRIVLDNVEMMDDDDLVLYDTGLLGTRTGRGSISQRRIKGKKNRRKSKHESKTWPGGH